MITAVRTRLVIIRVTAAPVRIEDRRSVELHRGASAVWSFIKDPASTIAMLETTETATVLPGSPDGVGEIQVFVEASKAGRTANLLEVTEVEPDRRAVYRSLSTWYPSGGEVSLKPLGQDSCRLTQRFWADLPTGLPAKEVRKLRTSTSEMLQTMMRRLTDLAADGSI